MGLFDHFRADKTSSVPEEKRKLKDFHPYDTGLPQQVLALALEWGDRGIPERRECSRDQFLALLAGVPALRKTPGIPGPGESGEDHFTTLPLCATEADRAACRTHLEKVFGITDKESMLAFCDKELRCHNNYLDFEGFWEGRPPFDPTPLTKDGPSFFTVARDFSAQFYPVVGHKGYLAWDISECMGHLRAGYACGLLTREEFDKLAGHWVIQAQIFENWVDYAVSLICGELYWDFRQGAKMPQLEQGLELWLRLTRQLLEENGAWGSGMWYVPPREKEYKLWASEMKEYLPDWQGPAGCFATDEITVAGKKVGWCYREKPSGEYPDSGWRFFSGEESEAYVNDPSHTSVYHLNTICNYDPDILPLLTAPYGTAYGRGEDGKFHTEPYTPPEEREGGH